jgi:hypothetical protein
MSKVNDSHNAQQQSKAAASGERAPGVEGLSEFQDNRESTFAQLKLADAIASSPPMVRQRESVRGIFGGTAQLKGNPAVVQRDIAAGSEELQPGGQYDKPKQNVEKNQVIKLYGQAWEAQGELFAKTRAVAAATDGKPSFPPGLKDLETSKDKIAREYGGDASQIVDLVRSTIVYKDVAALLKAMPEIQSQFTIARLKNKFMTPVPGGYRDINMNVQMSNGHIGELQVNLEGIVELKAPYHKVYEEVRVLPQDRGTWAPEVKEKIDKLEAEWAQKFEDAMAKSGTPEDQEKLRNIKEVGIKKK